MKTLKNANRKIKPTKFNVYTDGSKMEGEIGSGYQIYHKGERWDHEACSLPGYVTVFQVEVLAIRLGAERLGLGLGLGIFPPSTSTIQYSIVQYRRFIVILFGHNIST